MERTASFPVDLAIYPLECILGAAYGFLDRAYVFLETAPEDRVLVHLTARPDLPATARETLVGDFQAELLSQSYRLLLAPRFQAIRETILEAALRGAAGGDAPVENWEADPLGIAMSWEDKYGGEKP
jgi:His-Xaa-Ser system protein HxsD